MSAYLGLGITEGAKAIQQYEQGRATREAQQQAAMNQRKLSEMKLNEYESQAPLRQQQMEADLAVAREQARKANQQNLRSINYSAFDRYEADGDVRHLNNMLSDVKKNPIGAKANTNIVRYDSLSDTPEIRQQMERAGFYDFDGILNNPEMKKSFVVTTNDDGSKQVWDVDKVYAATGYTKYAEANKLEELKLRAQRTQLLQNGMSLSAIEQKDLAVKSYMEHTGEPYHKSYEAVTAIEKGASTNSEYSHIAQIAEEEKISTLEATAKHYDLKNSGKRKTDQERFIEAELAKDPNADVSKIIEKHKNLSKTPNQKDTLFSEESAEVLDEMNFLDSKLEDYSNADKSKIRKHVRRIQEANDVKFSQKDKDSISNFRKLLDLGGTVSEKMTPEETGLIDSTLRGFKKYLVDEVGGSEATSSYETFRNVFRNALYGSALTDNEIKAFNSAAGTLGERFKPTMQKFQTQLKTIKSQLESVANLSDPYVSHYYIGEDLDYVDEVIYRIDERIGLADVGSESEGVTTDEVMSDLEKPSLEDIMGSID